MFSFSLFSIAIANYKIKIYSFGLHCDCFKYTDELQWLEHIWNYESVFETGVF